MIQDLRSKYPGEWQRYIVEPSGLDDVSLANQLGFKQLALIPQFFEAKNKVIGLREDINYLQSGAGIFLGFACSFQLAGHFLGLTITLIPSVTGAFMAAYFELSSVLLNNRLITANELISQINSLITDSTDGSEFNDDEAEAAAIYP